MAQMREQKLVMDGSVCEDAHSYEDPNVRTANDARAKGKKRCPVFEECMHRNMLDRRRIRCAAIFGQHVARYAMEDGTSVEVEMEAFRKDAFSSGNSVANFGFIDPYEDPDSVITDHAEATAAVERWAKTVLYVPEPENSEAAPAA
jgi:hypothetical protein